MSSILHRAGVLAAIEGRRLMKKSAKGKAPLSIDYAPKEEPNMSSDPPAIGTHNWELILQARDAARAHCHRHPNQPAKSRRHSIWRLIQARGKETLEAIRLVFVVGERQKGRLSEQQIDTKGQKGGEKFVLALVG